MTSSSGNSRSSSRRRASPLRSVPRTRCSPDPPARQSPRAARLRLDENREFPDEEVIGRSPRPILSGGRFHSPSPGAVVLEDALVRESTSPRRKGKKIASCAAAAATRCRARMAAGERAPDVRRPPQRRRQAHEDGRGAPQAARPAHAPKRIECFGHLELPGRQIVGSVVVSTRATRQEPLPALPREGVAGQATSRACTSAEATLHAGGRREWLWPDLMGSTVARAARRGVAVLAELGIQRGRLVSLPRTALASDPRSPEIRHSQRARVHPDRKNPVVLPRNSTALSCCSACVMSASLRDHVPPRLRARERLRSVLDDLPGVGPKRRRSSCAFRQLERVVARAPRRSRRYRASAPEIARQDLRRSARDREDRGPERPPGTRA